MRNAPFPRRSIHSLVLVFVAAAAVACAAVPAVEPAATPTPCARAFSAARCDVIRLLMARELGVEVETVTSVEILPASTSDGRSPEIGVLLADGSRHRVTLHCGGIASGYVPACMDEPTLRAESVLLGGDRDIPCTGDTAGSCATPHPPIQPEAAAEAQAIEVEAVDIPVDALGLHAVPIGQGSVPNGILTEATFVLADPWPDGLVILDGAVRLDVRTLEPDGRPFRNYYEHGWREGVERVEAVIVFQADHVEPGAVLRIRDLVVR